MPWQILLNPYAVVTIIVSLALLSVPIIPVEVTVNEPIFQPLSFELTSPPRILTKTELLIFTKVVALQSIKNTDNISGTFELNFVFDNSVERDTTTESVDLRSGEEKVVYTDVPISGQANVSVNVIPPKRMVLQKKVIKKNVDAWSLIFGHY